MKRAFDSGAVIVTKVADLIDDVRDHLA